MSPLLIKQPPLVDLCRDREPLEHSPNFLAYSACESPASTELKVCPWGGKEELSLDQARTLPPPSSLDQWR